MGSFFERFENDKPSRETKVDNPKGTDHESCSQILLQTRLVFCFHAKKKKGGDNGDFITRCCVLLMIL